MTSEGLTFRDLRNAILFAAFVFVVLYFISHIVDVILVFSITLLVVITFSPVVTWMDKHGIPRWAGTALLFSCLLGTLGLLVYLLAPTVGRQFAELVQDLPSLLGKLQYYLTRLSARVPGVDVKKTQVDLSTLGQLVKPLLGGLAQITTGTLAILAGMVVVLVTSVYALINPAPLVEGFLNSVSPEHRPRLASAGQRVAVQVWAWAKGSAFAMLTIFVLTWLALWLLGFKQALLFAVIAGFLELIPVIGPILSAVGPVVVALVANPILALWVIVVFIVIQQVESHILIPMVMSRQVNLHPVTVIFWVLVMGALFGIIGIFIATPTAIVAGVLYDELYLCEYCKRCGEKVETGPIAESNKQESPASEN